MKKVLLVLSLFLLTKVALAADVEILPEGEPKAVKVTSTASSIPALKQGFAFSLADNNFNYLTTIDLVQWKFLNLEGGYAGAAANTKHKAVLVASVDLLKVGDVTTFPILNKLVFRPGVWVGYGNLNFKEMGESEFDYGVSATFFDVKW